MNAADLRALATYHNSQCVALARAAETTDERPIIVQGLHAKAAWHRAMSAKLFAAANAIELDAASPAVKTATQPNTENHASQ